MEKQVTGDSEPLVRWAQQLIKYHEAVLASQVDRLAISVEQVRDESKSPLYLCRVQVSGAGMTSMEVEERQADFALAVNRALARTVRSLWRRQSNRLSV